jgi:hypothetical protein
MTGRGLAGQLAAVTGVALLVAACTASGTQAKPVAGRPSGPVAEVTLTPVHHLSTAELTAAAGVIRHRAGLLGLQPVQVVVSGQDVVLTGPQPSQAQLATLAMGGVLAFRPVLLNAPPAGGGPYGAASRVSAATMRLFGTLACQRGPSPTTVDDGWKATVGYTNAQQQYDAAGSQVVSCDPTGSKYVLGPAVLTGQDITKVQVNLGGGGTEWVVELTLDGRAKSAFGALTTTQYNDYYQPFQLGGGTNQNDQVLAETAIVLDGDVQSAPVAQTPITGGQLQISGGNPGYSADAAENLAALLTGGPLPVSLRVVSVRAVVPTPSG